MSMGFTPAELAEMARADAHQGRAEAQRRYREANREKVAEGKRELREFRSAFGLTQKSFAALLGVSQSLICYWETISPPKDWREIIKNAMEVVDSIPFK